VTPTINSDGSVPSCQPGDPAPAKAAGLRQGDVLQSIDGVAIASTDQAQAILQGKRGQVSLVIERGGRPLRLQVAVAPSTTLDPKTRKMVPAGRIGIGFASYQTLNPITAVPATFAYTGTLFAQTGQGLLMFPQKIPAVWRAIQGAPPDLNRPVSVVGASIVGGDLVQHGAWAYFLLLLGALNFFVGVFNLVPLLPLDGGHIAVNLYERLRDVVRQRMGKAKMPPVDYTKLLPVTYAFILVLGAISLLTIVADIVNPIRL
jgi:membrane-associated protease RseP (regulator of RpoE activity)